MGDKTIKIAPIAKPIHHPHHDTFAFIGQYLQLFTPL
jgi:hypothetical protein